MTYRPINWEQRWRDDARRWGRCPECGNRIPERLKPSYYCSIWCTEPAWRRQFPERAATEPTFIERLRQIWGVE